MSLRTIADATKISVRALEALERNDISQLPGGIFSRAFVRAYASEVGLEPEQTIAEFLTQFPHDSVAQGHPRTRSLVDELDGVKPSGSGLRVGVAVFAVLVVVAALYFWLSTARAGVAESGRQAPGAASHPRHLASR